MLKAQHNPTANKLVFRELKNSNTSRKKRKAREGVRQCKQVSSKAFLETGIHKERTQTWPGMRSWMPQKATLSWEKNDYTPNPRILNGLIQCYTIPFDTHRFRIKYEFNTEKSCRLSFRIVHPEKPLSGKCYLVHMIYL